MTYMCGLYEDTDKTDRLFERVDTAPRGRWLRGDELAAEMGLPVPVIRSVFKIYERRGLGHLSGIVGETNYLAQA